MTEDLRTPRRNGHLSPAALPALLDGERVSARPVDPGTVRDVRRAVAEVLAARLQADAVPDPAARRELARSLLAAELSARARARVASGLDPWPVETEMAVASAVMAALFGLGRLQPLVDDPLVENIEVDGCDSVWISYADGHDRKGDPVAESDAELIELLQLLAARTGADERTFTSATRPCTCASRTGHAWRRWPGRRRGRTSSSGGTGSRMSTSTTSSASAPSTTRSPPSSGRRCAQGRTWW